MPTEKPRFELLARVGPVEIRRYAPLIVAETFVEGELGPAGTEGFRRLQAYIAGDNRARREIDCPRPLMKARPGPVPAAASGFAGPGTAASPASPATTPTTIAMTAPVGQRPGDGGYWVSFVMPAGFSLVTLPQPSHPRIRLREIDARIVAAIRFRGWWRPRTVRRYRQELEQWARRSAVAAAGEPVYARYNPPWVPGFLRRNEILLPLTGWPGATTAAGSPAA
jgi:hypothetical protein